MSTMHHGAETPHGKGSTAEIRRGFPPASGWAATEDAADCHSNVERYRG